MSECTIQISPDLKKEGIAYYYDIQTNKVFVKADGEYKWYPRCEIHLTQDINMLPGLKPQQMTKSFSPSISFDRNEANNSDSILSLMQRCEYDLLHPNVRTDMRRLEFEYMISSSLQHKKKSRNLDQIQTMEIPCSTSYYPCPSSSKHSEACNHSLSPSKKHTSQHKYSFANFNLNSTSKSFTTRQKLLCWIYDHGNFWTKASPSCRSSKPLPSNKHIKKEFVKENEKELYTVAFNLNEYGYSSLFPHFLLQDTLSRVYNYKDYQKYSKPLQPPSSAACIRIQSSTFYLQSIEFTLGAISTETFLHLKEMNPAIVSIVENIGNCDVSIVDDDLPSKVISIFWCSTTKQWKIRALDSHIQFSIKDKEYGIRDESVSLDNQEVICISNHTIFFSVAKCD